MNELLRKCEASLIGSTSVNGDHRFCVSKGLLNFLSKYPMGSAARCSGEKFKSGKELFAKYMDEFVLVGMDINLNCFKRWSNGRNHFYFSLYGADDSTEPKNFDAKKQFDLARIGELLDLNIVVFFVRSVEKATEDEVYSSLDIFNDYSDFQPPRSSTKSVYFLMTPGRLYHLLNPDNLKNNLGWSLTKRMSLRSEKGVLLTEVGLGEALCRLNEVGDEFATCPTLAKVQKTSQIIFADSEVTAMLDRLEEPTVIAVYTRRGGTSVFKNFRRELLKRSVFEIVYKSKSLSYAASQVQDFKMPERPDVNILVCLGGTDIIVRPKLIVSDVVYNLLKILPAEDKFDSSYIFSGLAPGRDFEDRLRERKKKAREKKMKNKEEQLYYKKTFCECEICFGAVKEYEFNMDEDGPEKLLTVDFGCKELLKLLGLDSDENLLIIDELVSLSMAAFDIESKTVEVDSDKPSSNLYSQIDPQMSVEGHYKKVQRPIMVAHLDGLDLDGIPETWTAAGDDDREAYRMMESYFLALEKRKELARFAKLNKVKELRETINKWRQQILNFFVQHFSNNPPSAEDEARGHCIKNFYSAYRNTLLGKLDCRISLLCEQYVVYSFYGSGYDHVILFSYLAPLWYELKRQPKIEKKGNKISCISLKGRLTFRDITKMLAPGTDLRNFGKLFGLEQKKAHFPFSLLTSVDVLKLEELPSDPAVWKSDLGGKETSPKDIEEAQELYREAGCKTLGDYLKTYLKLDVVVLYKASILWAKNLVQLVGVDFVESRKFTISSMSNYAGTLCQAERMRIGSFFPNNRRTYGLFKRGMRG